MKAMVEAGRLSLRTLGRGVIAGAADDDPSAIGTYASAGAAYGLGFLWIAPCLLPMMIVVVYLAAKLGRVSGRGLFSGLRERVPRSVLVALAAVAVAGNVIEAAADLGGMGSALHLLLPVPRGAIVVASALAILVFQLLGGYRQLTLVFRWLALALLAYVAAALLARPDPVAVLRGTLVPTIHWNAAFLSTVVACVGTSLSAYVYTWQSNQEVEDQIAEGRHTLRQRRGASTAELRRTGRDVHVGMLFSSLVLYFIIMSAGAALHGSGHRTIETAADAAGALRPLAGPAASWLFAAGVVGVGFLAVPVMSTGAAWNVVQAFGGEASLHARPHEAKLFYAVVAGTTAFAVGLNFLGLNPMRALVWSGIVQGFSVPVLLLFIMRLTNDRGMMGAHVNTRLVNVLGWTTNALTMAAAIGLAASWVA